MGHLHPINFLWSLMELPLGKSPLPPLSISNSPGPAKVGVFGSLFFAPCFYGVALRTHGRSQRGFEFTFLALVSAWVCLQSPSIYYRRPAFELNQQQHRESLVPEYSALPELCCECACGVCQ
jgi:hypothetical protein